MFAENLHSVHVSCRCMSSILVLYFRRRSYFWLLVLSRPVGYEVSRWIPVLGRSADYQESLADLIEVS